MRSSSRRRALGCALALLATFGLAGRASAQQQADGFAVERLYRSAPGAGWMVMDELDLHGGLGGALSLNLGYAGQPLRVSDGLTKLSVVSSQASMDLAAAITYDRWRFYLDLDMPLAILGDSGVVGGVTFKGPSLSPSTNPDVISDVRLGVDVRIVGRPPGPFRFGLGAQLWVPFGARADYDTDGTFRGMVRALFAGDAPYFTWAAQLGVHIRPLDDPSTPGSPRGSELLFGVAAGARIPVGHGHAWAVVVGPEIFGATAFHAFFGAQGSAVEALLSGRIEDNRRGRVQMRVKLGAGAGLYPHLGAPEWRLVLGVELFGTHVQPSRE